MRGYRWKVSYLGLLFGLGLDTGRTGRTVSHTVHLPQGALLIWCTTCGTGLDTAAEVGLLTLSALALPGVPRACALVLPALFAAGMALVDSRVTHGARPHAHTVHLPLGAHC